MGGGNQSKMQKNESMNQNHFQNLIQNTFNRASQNTFITKQQFNQCLRVFESVNLMFICNTFFAARLFEIFDIQRNNKVSKKEIINIFKRFLNQPEKCLQYTFRMYDLDNDKSISRREFSDFFQKSWLTSVEIVNQRLKLLQNVNSIKIYQWLKDKKQDINQLSAQIFGKINQTGDNYISYKQFEKWIKSGDYDLIIFQYQDVIIKFPLHIDALINPN